MKSKKLFLCLLAAALTLTSVCGAYAEPALIEGTGVNSIIIATSGDVTENESARGDNAIAIGNGTSASGNNSLAIGHSAKANSTGGTHNAIAIGNSANAASNNTIALGNSATASMGYGIAIGYSASTLEQHAIAIGNTAKANGEWGIAIGNNAEANEESIAIGRNTKTANYSTAIGDWAEATGGSSTAIGYDSIASGAGAAALGGDAVGNYSVALGTQAKANGPYSFAGADADADGEYSIAIDYQTKVSAESEHSTAIGYNASATKKWSTAVGHYAKATGEESSAFGRYAKASGEQSIAIGYAEASATGSAALGAYAKANGERSTALGRSAVADGKSSVALGDKAKAQAENSVAIGTNSSATEADTVSIGNNTTQRRLVNLMAGRAATDAVNVSQLNDLNTLLGGSTISNGQWGEKFTVDGTEYNSVADAISSLASGSDNAVLYDGDDKSTVKLGGTNGTTITNLAAGVNATDAVNFGQLSSLGDKIASTLGGDFKFENGTLTGGFTYGNETTIQGAFDSIRDELDKLSEGWTFNPVDDAQQSGGDGGAGTGEGATPPASSTIKPGDSLTVNAGDDINITQNADKDYTISVAPSLREEIEEGYTAADSALKTEITEAYQQADSALKTEITEAYQQADSALKTEITEAYQQADSALKADIDKNSETIGEIGSVLGGAENGYKKPTFDTVTANDINVGKVNISGSGINMGGADIATGGGNIDMGGGRITNVTGGAIAQGSTDAVNGGQLWDAYQRMDAMGGDIYRRMDDLREDVNIVGAHAAALSGLHPIDYNPYEPTTLSAAVGTYRDEYAVAVGVFHYTRENVMFNLGASLCSDGDIMGRAGVSFTLGKSSKKQPLPPKDMNEVQAQLAQVQQATRCRLSSRRFSRRCLS